MVCLQLRLQCLVRQLSLLQVNPLPGTSLYFVARGDGSHQFSDTNEEHQKAVRYYQINKRVKNYQSLPPQK